MGEARSRVYGKAVLETYFAGRFLSKERAKKNFAQDIIKPKLLQVWTTTFGEDSEKKSREDVQKGTDSKLLRLGKKRAKKRASPQTSPPGITISVDKITQNFDSFLDIHF